MKARVIKSFTDKYTFESIASGVVIEISNERFSELTTGPRGVFVEKIEEKPIEKKAASKKATKK